MSWHPGERISVEEIQQLYPELGIPHFQRGLVWGRASVSALLESLFLDTPCGSFVFWGAKNPLEFGEPLSIDKAHDLKYLIVDGQQRIRTIVAALEDRDVELDPDESENEDQGGAEEEGSERWCINLTRVAEMANVLEPFGREYSLFLRTADPLFEPRKQDAGSGKSDDAGKSARRSPFRHNIVPLRPILDSDQPELEKYESLLRFSRTAKEGPQDLRTRLARIYEQVRLILKRKFFVTIRDEQEISRIVSLYNRINSGGKKVEAEERAFARLLDLDAGTYHQIARMFADVHRPDPGEMVGPEAADLCRDDVMKRQKEKNFGFKLFLRTFIQVCNYHFNRATGKDQLAFGVIETAGFARWMRETPAADREFLWNETHAVVTQVRDLLRDELNCDELAFLPDATSFLPVFQLLIQFVELRETQYRPLMASLGLLYLLADLDTRELLTDVGDIKDRHRVAFEVIPVLWKKLQSKVETRIRKDKVLEKADSIQNRYVLLLYWLLRKKKARDFSYGNVPTSPLKGQEQKSLRRQVDPEKQHIVPFSRLKDALSDPDARRGSSHRFNNIGNFTYISRDLNGYTVGLGNKFVDLNLDEAPLPDGTRVLEAHFLADPAVRQAYGKLVGAMPIEGPFNKERIEKFFQDFCKKRRALIADAMLQDWLVELRDRACDALDVPEIDGLLRLAIGPKRIEAQKPRCVSDEALRPSQQISLLPYDHTVRDALCQYVADLRGKAVEWKGQALLANLGNLGWLWLKLGAEGVRLEVAGFVDEGARNLVREALGLTKGEDFLYTAGAPEVPTDLLERLCNAAVVARTQEARLDAAREQQREELKLARISAFEAGWSEHEEGKTLAQFRKLEKELASSQKPELDLDWSSRTPAFRIKLRGKLERVLRARSSPPWIRDCVPSKFAKTGQDRQVVAAFRLALRKLPGSGLVEEEGVQCPVASCLAKVDLLRDALRDLAASLSRREE